jgi:hypothetical protein
VHSFIGFASRTDEAAFFIALIEKLARDDGTIARTEMGDEER